MMTMIGMVSVAITMLAHRKLKSNQSININEFIYSPQQHRTRLTAATQQKICGCIYVGYDLANSRVYVGYDLAITA